MARSAGLAELAVDYDFDWYVFAFEYCQANKDFNKNDLLYLDYCELLMRAQEYGLGYRVEYDNTLHLVSTPLVLLDSDNRFHSDNAPAIRWKEGAELYFIHGVKVDKKIVLNPETITKEEIVNEKNEEVRRVMAERVGAEKFCKMMNFEVLSEDDFGALLQTKINEDIYTYAHVLCPSTGREYYLQVPHDLDEALLALRASKGATWEKWTESDEESIWPNSGKMETCKQAVAWTFGKSVQEYSPLIQT